MKLLNKEGFKYSREEFEDYKFRTIFNLSISDDWRNDTKINIYTNNPSKQEVIELVNSLTTDKVKFCGMEYWTTKEQDDLTTQFIEEILKDI